MPLGEAVGEFFFRAVLEIVLHGLLFGFGYLFLKLISLGRLPLAPFSTFGDRNSSEKSSGPGNGAFGSSVENMAERSKRNL
jgi:hypothetical protein